MNGKVLVNVDTFLETFIIYTTTIPFLNHILSQCLNIQDLCAKARRPANYASFITSACPRLYKTKSGRVEEIYEDRYAFVES